MREFEIVDRNLRAAMRFFGEAVGTGEVRELEGVDAVYSGLDYGVFNIAMLSTAPSSSQDLDARLKVCANYYGSRRTRWSFWLCENHLDVRLQRRSKQLLSDLGLRVISEPPAMIAPGLGPPQRSLPALEVRLVAEQSARDSFAGITAVCFDIPFRIAQSVYQPERAWMGPYRGYVGLVKGEPVTIAAIVAAGGVLGIYSVATLPAFRHRGYGEALMRAAIDAERNRTGFEKLVLQSTEAGHRLYKRLGFRDVAKYSVYLTK